MLRSSGVLLNISSCQENTASEGSLSTPRTLRNTYLQWGSIGGSSSSHHHRRREFVIVDCRLLRAIFT